MSARKKNAGLGNSLMKDLKQMNKSKPGAVKKQAKIQRHTTNVDDGYEWAKSSVTEQKNLDEFLTNAELANVQFTAERRNAKIVDATTAIGVISAEDRRKKQTAAMQHQDVLRIPRRPKWDPDMSTAELSKREIENFLEWRRQLAMFEEAHDLVLTPFEKNLEFWRQLWRVVERSDILVQILDARNPLLFYCEDLERYTREIGGAAKENMVLLNKSDFLTEDQRKCWATYFEKRGIRAVFFSALDEGGSKSEAIEEEQDEEQNEKPEKDQGSKDAHIHKNEEKDHESAPSDGQNKQIHPNHLSAHEAFEDLAKAAEIKLRLAQSSDEQSSEINTTDGKLKNSWSLVSKDDLMEFWRQLHDESKPKVKEGITTVGLVGYPNVGKSSSINALLKSKKVSVSATPGKTKHFQTIYLTEDLMLCDCPGLVFPNFVCTKADLIINGILPIDQMTNHVAPITQIASMIPRQVFADFYGIILPKPSDDEDPNRPLTCEELCNAYGLMRGYLTQRAVPDNPRASRYILKDFVNGKLLFCYAPPGVDQASYHKFDIKNPKHFNPDRELTTLEKKVLGPQKPTTASIDNEFFTEQWSQAHVKGPKSLVDRTPGNFTSTESLTAKPWKDHKNKRNKKEKLRRVYNHLDE